MAAVDVVAEVLHEPSFEAEASADALIDDSSDLFDIHRLMKELPQDLFAPSYRKACRALFLSLSVMVLGYVALVFAPWFLMPLCWFVVGTATLGLAAVAYDCGNYKFVRHKFINDIVGMLCLAPLWTPFYAWKESQNQQPSERLAHSPFWCFIATWQWIKVNFATSMSKKLIMNLVIVYAFVCLFFPIMTQTVGIWGLFKYYFIPLAIYHVWMSSFLKVSHIVEIEGAPILLYSYPRWIERIANMFNLMTAEFRVKLDGMPSYNSKAAREAIMNNCSQMVQEVQVGWMNLLGLNNKPTVRTLHWSDDRLLMRVHNQWYDLTEFKHPGGPIAISLGANREATALFEAHHAFTSRARLNGLLNKYRVSEERARDLKNIDAEFVDQKPEYRFKWDTLIDNETSTTTTTTATATEYSDFSTELRARVKAYFAAEARRRGVSLLDATKATPFRWFIMLVSTALFLSQIPLFIAGYYFTIITLPLMAWVFAANIAHDAMHFSVSTDWRINAILSYVCPFTASPLQWYHQHVIGHHAYPNVPHQDPDLAHAPAFMRVHPSIRWKPAHAYQRITTAIVWSIGATLYMTLVPLKALYLGVLNRSVPISRLTSTRVFMHVTGRAITAALLWGWQWYVFQGDIARQVLFTVVPMLVHSVAFMLATQVNHLTEENVHAFDSDYYRHQVLTSHSFAPDSWWTFWFSGGLNLQIEHHLFPSVNHCHLAALQPIVKSLCIKYNIPYHESPDYVVALQKYWNHICNMSRPSLSTH